MRDHGHEILVRNYKTRFYEIEIISRKGKYLYFAEAKCRHSNRAGDGLAAIAPAKLTQMKRAATDFLANFRDATDSLDVKIAVISLSHEPPTIDEFIENVAD